METKTYLKGIDNYKRSYEKAENIKNKNVVK